MKRKTVLLVDDEQGFLEALADALEHEGYRVLKARTAVRALDLLRKEEVDLMTLDVMMPPGEELEGATDSSQTGLWLARRIRDSYPTMHVFCLSVVSDRSLIRQIESTGARFLRKGETPLKTVLNMIRSSLTGVAYSTERDVRRQ